jgi:glycine/D-amino acid oxidase-like deaminating enzyme
LTKPVLTWPISEVGLNRSLWDTAPLGVGHQDGIAGDTDHVFDVCIIGSGASGAVVADHLVRRGVDVLLLEQGGRLRADARNAELDRTCERAFARDDAGRWTPRGWPWTTSNLGGGTVFYGGASFRYAELDFDPSAQIRVDDLDVRWSFGRDTLLPYYEALERRLRILDAAVAHGAELQCVYHGQSSDEMNAFIDCLTARGYTGALHHPLGDERELDRFPCGTCIANQELNNTRARMQIRRGLPIVGPVPGLESLAAQRDRLRRFAADLRATTARCAVVVSHAFSIELLLGALLHLEPTSVRSVRFKVSHAAIFALEVPATDREATRLVVANARAHLGRLS